MSQEDKDRFETLRLLEELYAEAQREWLYQAATEIVSEELNAELELLDACNRTTLPAPPEVTATNQSGTYEIVLPSAPRVPGDCKLTVPVVRRVG